MSLPSSDPHPIERQITAYTPEGRLTLEKELKEWLKYQKSEGQEYPVIVCAQIGPLCSLLTFGAVAPAASYGVHLQQRLIANVRTIQRQLHRSARPFCRPCLGARNVGSSGIDHLHLHLRGSETYESHFANASRATEEPFSQWRKTGDSPLQLAVATRTHGSSRRQPISAASILRS